MARPHAALRVAPGSPLPGLLHWCLRRRTFGGCVLEVKQPLDSGPVKSGRATERAAGALRPGVYTGGYTNGGLRCTVGGGFWRRRTRWLTRQIARGPALAGRGSEPAATDPPPTTLLHWCTLEEEYDGIGVGSRHSANVPDGLNVVQCRMSTRTAQKVFQSSCVHSIGHKWRTVMHSWRTSCTNGGPTEILLPQVRRGIRGQHPSPATPS